MNRTQRQAVARETIAILEAGRYSLPDGRTVSIADDLRRAREGTILVRPDDGLAIGFEPVEPSIDFADETTLAGAVRLAALGLDPVALNFASARNPGGGFESGAQAQEESLARASGLFEMIRDSPLHAIHRADANRCLYTDHVIHSPRVPVFRLDDGALLERPILVSFLTCPAVNAGAARRKGVTEDEIEAAMKVRIARVLAVAVDRGHRAIVLGAWGCGVFANRVERVGALFAEQLRGPFEGAFGHVLFAIPGDHLAPFRTAFEGGSP